ncbi:MAG: NADH-quinone oxidoreductase subunit J [Micrococcales bacterium]|nr:NADH-quinone oxidoreductase subunit J [Micrococcales bacterium]
MSGVLTALTDAGQMDTGEAILFWVLAPLIVIASLGLVFARKAVYAAVSVISVMIMLAALYVAQEAPFLGMVQVVVYTGAVMMLFLFVLMLVGVDAGDSLVETVKGQRIIGVLGGLGVLAVLSGVVGTAVYSQPSGLAAVEEAVTNPVGLAYVIFGQHAFALEVVGALLITAALGALVLTHRERLIAKLDQRTRLDARMRALAGGGTVTPLPAPGVYARHNAMDVPALDPEGRPIESSVNRVLKVRGQEADADEYAARVDRVLAGGWADAPEVTEAPAAPEVDAAPEADGAATDEPGDGPSSAAPETGADR